MTLTILGWEMGWFGLSCQIRLSFRRQHIIQNELSGSAVSSAMTLYCELEQTTDRALVMCCDTVKTVSLTAICLSVLSAKMWNSCEEEIWSEASCKYSFEELHSWKANTNMFQFNTVYYINSYSCKISVLLHKKHTDL